MRKAYENDRALKRRLDQLIKERKTIKGEFGHIQRAYQGKKTNPIPYQKSAQDIEITADKVKKVVNAIDTTIDRNKRKFGSKNTASKILLDAKDKVNEWLREDKNYASHMDKLSEETKDLIAIAKSLGISLKEGKSDYYSVSQALVNKIKNIGLDKSNLTQKGLSRIASLVEEAKNSAAGRQFTTLKEKGSKGMAMGSGAGWAIGSMLGIPAPISILGGLAAGAARDAYGGKIMKGILDIEHGIRKFATKHGNSKWAKILSKIGSEKERAAMHAYLYNKEPEYRE
jgi:hypothetical protein